MVGNKDVASDSYWSCSGRKGFHNSDANKGFTAHRKLGIGLKAFYPEKRVKTDTLIRAALRRRILYESYSEELRILYVAMTRAKNKLIMTGYIKNDADLEKYSEAPILSSALFSGSATFLSWITPLVMTNDSLFDISVRYADMSILRQGMEASRLIRKREELEKYTKTHAGNGVVSDMIAKQTDYIYPFDEETRFPVKVSVSEIKHDRAMEKDEEATEAAWLSTERPVYIPKFAKEETKEIMTGAARGTLYHTLMEYIDIEKADSIKHILYQIEELIQKGVLPEEALSEHIIAPSKILKFCEGDAAKRMTAAKKKGKLFLEKPFVMGVPASMIYEGTKSGETIIVQGIIDAFFEEDDGIVLLDYKTDSISAGSEHVLIDRYAAQMENYRMAIEKSTGKKVKEIILYSFALGKEIRL